MKPLAASLCVALLACGSVPDEPIGDLEQGLCTTPACERTYGGDACLPSQGFTCAPATGVVPLDRVQPLGGALAGPRVWKSNNPESFTGTGWLMQAARTDAQRGGARSPLSGDFTAYFYHANKSGRPLWVHLVATNPQAATVRITGEGSAWTNADQPLRAGAGPGWRVAADVLQGTPRTRVDATVGRCCTANAVEIVKARLGDRQLVDGRFELNGTAGVLLYTVVTERGRLADAIAATQGPPAPGDLARPSVSTYGREAGVYEASEWNGRTNILVPQAPAHLGLAFNTGAKFAVRGVRPQDQTAGAVVSLSDSSPRTYGNYGHSYDVTLALKNPSPAQSRTVRLSFASTYVAAADVPSFTWNGPARLVVDGRPGPLLSLFTTPTRPRQTIGSWTLAPGSLREVRLMLVVPGLISQGEEILVESI